MKQRDNQAKDLAAVAARAVGLVGGGLSALAGGWIAYSALAINHRMPLPYAIEAERGTFASTIRMMLNYYHSREGAGRPLVLLHSINAAASAYEMRPLFEHYRAQRPVYALDLPGFGMSGRLPREYTPQLYASAIVDFLATQVREPADVIALSLTSEFAARAALWHPEWFHTLTLISPTGFKDRNASDQMRERGGSEIAHQVLAFPLWTRALYDLLVTRPSLHYFLQKSVVGPVDRGLAEYAYLTAHQPGARHAPLYFISGRLFSPNIRTAVYQRLTLPVMVIYDQDAYTRFDALPSMGFYYRNWHTQRVSTTRGLPHFERLGETVQALDGFWRDTAREQRAEGVELS